MKEIIEELESTSHSLFDILIERKDKHFAFLAGNPGTGTGFLFKQEILKASLFTNDTVYVIDTLGDCEKLCEKLCAEIATCENDIFKFNRKNCRVVDFVVNDDLDFAATSLKFIEDSCDTNKTTWLFIRNTSAFLDNSKTLDILEDIIKYSISLNIKVVFEDYDLSALLEKIKPVIIKNQDLIILSHDTSCANKIVQDLKFDSSVTSKITSTASGEGIFVKDGIVSDFANVFKSGSPSFSLLTK